MRLIRFYDDQLIDNLSISHERCKWLNMSYEIRFYCFVLCAITGISLYITGILLLIILNFAGFIALYILANIFVILATLFLFGPIEQIKNTIKSIYNIIAHILFLISIIIIIVSASVFHSPIVCIIFIFHQICIYVFILILSVFNYKQEYYQIKCCKCLK